VVVAGVDIGQRRDFTAVVTLDNLGAVRGAHRLRLGQRWETIVASVAELVETADPVVIDATGVGAPVAEVLGSRITGKVIPLVFTSSSKRELVGMLAHVIGERRIHVPPDCPGADDLSEELRRFVASPTRTGWALTGKAGGGHDDLVMALALAVRAALFRRMSPSPRVH